LTITSGPADLVKQADEVAQALGAYLQTLPADGWVRPSDCAGWSVSNAVAHLVLVQDLLGSSIARGLSGDSGPPPEASKGVEAWRQWRSEETARLSTLAPGELLAGFRTGLETMREPLARLAAGDDGLKHGWHPAGEQPLPWFAGQWLVEVALHDWDIRVSADPGADVNPAALPGLGPEMRKRMVRCFKPEQAPGLEGIVRVDLAGPAPVAWLAQVAQGRLEVLDDGAGSPAATIHTDPGAYALVQTTRRRPDFFQERGRWQVSGDATLADRLAASFKGY
jgi:uncharacterized protein (TIGR03083 family)